MHKTWTKLCFYVWDYVIFLILNLCYLINEFSQNKSQTTAVLVPQRQFFAHLEFSHSFDLMAELSGLFDEVCQGLCEVARSSELGVCEHPQQVIQQNNEPTPDNGTVWRAAGDCKYKLEREPISTYASPSSHA